MATITKKDLIDRIADQTGQRRVAVKKTVQSFLDQVILELGKGNRLEFRDFGVFEIRERKARMAQNPKTLERVHVPSKKVVKFKVGRLMQRSLDDEEQQLVMDLDIQTNASLNNRANTQAGTQANTQG